MITDIETYILDAIDQQVEQASNDELFAGGYLRGHLTLAVAELEQRQNSDPEMLRQAVEQNLDMAIAGGELSPRDQILVRNLWQQLYQKASASL